MTNDKGVTSPKPVCPEARSPRIPQIDCEKLRRYSDEIIKAYGGHDQVPAGLFVG